MLLIKMSECCFPVGRVERSRASGTTYFNLLLMHEFSIIIASPVLHTLVLSCTILTIHTVYHLFDV